MLGVPLDVPDPVVAELPVDRVVLDFDDLLLLLFFVFFDCFFGLAFVVSWP